MDVVVVGGGVIGAAVAWELGRRGVRVTVVERDAPGGAATAAAGGMLSPLAESRRPGPFLELALASFERFPRFVEHVEEASGLAVEHRADGKLLLALDEAQAAELRQQAEWQRARGLRVELLEPAEARRLEPSLTEAFRAALLVETDSRVDSRLLGRALWLAAAHTGADFRLGSLAVAVHEEGGRARGVTLSDGRRVAADAVVVAAGCWSGQLAGLPRPLPVRPVRGQMAAVRIVPPRFRRVLYAPGCYLIPRNDGRVLIGATMEESGFRCHTTPSGLSQLFVAAARMVPALGEAPVEETWAGLRPGTPDDLPILGPDPELEGLVYATGHFRNGILLAPITAELLADLVTGAGPSLAVDPFAADRFAEAHL